MTTRTPTGIRRSVAVITACMLAACAPEEEPAVYQLVPVSTRDVVISASAAGTIEPVKTVEVKSKASGEVFEMPVETGDVVRAGQLLVRVDPRIPQATLRQAEADLTLSEALLENAQSRLRRADELYKTQSISEQEYEDAKLAVASANASLVRSQRSLEDARISAEDTDVKAPISGVVLQKNVEEGTVITSATQGVTGGTVLLQMANLDTVQVRALIDETDIGKIQPGLDVTTTVDAYPNRPFRGTVLKIEPQATEVQNVTMFAVLVRIGNQEGLLRPGMNAEVEVHIGERRGVLVVPNAALRTDRDVSSAAMVLGLDDETVRQQLAAASEPRTAPQGETAAAGANGDNGVEGSETIEWRGQRIPLPAGVTAEEVQAMRAKFTGGDPRTAFQSMSARERTVLRQLSQAAGGPGGDGRGGRRRGTSNTDALFGGNYIVFAVRGGVPTAVRIQTGLTDLDFSEVRSGLTEADTVLVLPSASLLRSQQEFNERIQRIRGSGLPGVQRSN